MSRVVRFLIDPTFLHQLLELPADVEIVRITTEDDSGCGFPTIMVSVASDRFPESVRGMPPLVNPTITQHRKTWDFNLPAPKEG